MISDLSRGLRTRAITLTYLKFPSTSLGKQSCPWYEGHHPARNTHLPQSANRTFQAPKVANRPLSSFSSRSKGLQNATWDAAALGKFDRSKSSAALTHCQPDTGLHPRAKPSRNQFRHATQHGRAYSAAVLSATLPNGSASFWCPRGYGRK